MLIASIIILNTSSCSTTNLTVNECGLLTVVYYILDVPTSLYSAYKHSSNSSDTDTLVLMSAGVTTHAAHEGTKYSGYSA